MLVRCSNKSCGRARIFNVHNVRDHWRTKRWSDRWRDLPLHFRCAICRARPEPPQWIEDLNGDMAPRAPHACIAPYGINPLAWALAAPDDREGLIKARR